ncbi:CCA tRNA nucleotidyltransferase [Aestuariivita boseongensis]|uniref:CCA tRNA nucleotidyltransferase n=1 Tax=Aestuariivita boseongensis TaxID=1470562 RepID=UPI000680466B|nr:CCA tRNA nucleotidyltransferase [Aestuariivita boseongensis]
MTKLTSDWIARAETQAVCRMLTDAGAQALFVGGCVRNAFLEAPVADIDIATDALPEQVVVLAEKAGLKAVPTGIDHGTVTVVSGGLPHEVTTFRRDVETDGRRAVVAFSTDVAEDAARRDFTMNALYANPEGEVIDPLGGLPDLQARHVRFIGRAEDRIREDHLRSLRFFRFHAWYGDPLHGMDADALAAIAEHLEGLAILSKERIGHEVMKLLAAPDPAPAVASMRQTGVLQAILPGADDTALGPLVHLWPEANATLRLAALGRGFDEALRLSKADARRAEALRHAAEEGTPAELGYRMGAEDACAALALRAALLQQPLEDSDLEVARHAATQVFPVKAGDLMPDFEGPALGAALKDLEGAWIASGFALTRDDLLAKAEDHKKG